jgi:hypothetical protein
MDSLFSFPVGLFHPLQHAGLSRRSPVCRPLSHYVDSGTMRRNLRLIPVVGVPPDFLDVEGDTAAVSGRLILEKAEIGPERNSKKLLQGRFQVCS